MGVPKGTDNFARWRAEGISANVALIRRELDQQKRRRIPYPDLRALVADISEKTGLHRTTLTRRGSQYLQLLLMHLAEQPGASAIVNDQAATPAVLNAKRLDARLELRTLKHRREVAERRTRTHAETEEASSMPSRTLTGPNWHLAFADTAIVLNLLIDRMNAIDETVQIDVEGGSLDLSAAARDRIVAGPERARWFVEYYKQRKAQQDGGKG